MVAIWKSQEENQLSCQKIFIHLLSMQHIIIIIIMLIIGLGVNLFIALTVRLSKYCCTLLEMSKIYSSILHTHFWTHMWLDDFKKQ